MSHRLSGLGGGFIKPELVLCPTNNQMCRGQQPPEHHLSAPVPRVSQRCCIEASLVESCYFLPCLREMKLCGTLTIFSVVMAELSAGFQKPFIALKCISISLFWIWEWIAKANDGLIFLTMSSSICGSLQLVFTWSALLTSFLKTTLMFWLHLPKNPRSLRILNKMN